LLALVAVLGWGCGSSNPPSAQPSAPAASSSARPSIAASVAPSQPTGSGKPVAAAKAKSAAEMGGIDALVAAAKAEGTLDVIGLPPDWANYGAIIDAFEQKYGLKVVSEQPDATSAGQIAAATDKTPTDPPPDVFDLDRSVALANLGLLAPYRVANWSDIPDKVKDAKGAAWYGDYGGYMSVGCDTSKVQPPAKVADLLAPRYEGMVALNGDPTTSLSAFHGVVMAAIANGGSADNLAPGVAFFKKLSDQGNLLPIDPNPGTIRSGQTPCVIDWVYTNASQSDALKGTMDFQVTVPSDAPPVAAFDVQAINKSAPHPAAARLREEYLYSPEGSNAWIKGFAVPATLDAMRANGTIDTSALAALPATGGGLVVLTPAQIAKGQAYLQANWKLKLN
jgi:putative spermidine/putrescine transport system substrate-binding protein